MGAAWALEMVFVSIAAGLYTGAVEGAEADEMGVLGDGLLTAGGSEPDVLGLASFRDVEAGGGVLVA